MSVERGIHSYMLVACLAALFGATGCGGDTAQPRTAAAPPAPAPQQAAPEVPQPAATAAPAAGPAATASAERFDREWAPHFAAGVLAYGAVKNLGFYSPTFGGAADPKAIRDFRARIAGQTRGVKFADWLQEINDLLLDRKLVQVSFIELFEEGFAFGVEHEPEQKDSEPEMTLVAPATAKVKAFVEAFEQQASKSGEVVRKELAGGKLTTICQKARPAALSWWIGPKVFVAGSDPARVEAALGRAAKGAGTVATAPGYLQAAGRLDPDAVALLVLNPARMAENLKAEQPAPPPAPPAPAGVDPAAMAAAMAANAHPQQRVLDTLSNLNTLWAQLVYRDSQSHLDFHLGFDPAGTAFPMLAAGASDKPLASPGLPPVNNPVFVAAALPKGDAVPKGDAAAVEAAESSRQMKVSAAMMLGLNYEMDVAPWLGREIAATVLWDVKFPQLAVMIAADDPEACKKAMNRVAANFKGKLAFEEKAVGDQKLYVAVQPGKPQVTPAWAVADGFLILATGQQVVEGLLDAPQKLKDSPGFAGLYSVMKSDRLQFAGFLSTDVLERLAEMGAGEPPLLQKQLQDACFKNMAPLKSGKLSVSQAICPAAGQYQVKGGEAECSVHGSEKQPKPLAADTHPQVAAAKQLASKVATVAAGGALVEPGLYRASVVFRKR
ncbi:MAG: DUF3352 domain-containing protein [Candidatus Wallbacteria bacterium]|nr:DUF3352 domain-containing protein [Candidatus Wallbacteria bacterium]